jgi:hypothetical protein
MSEAFKLLNAINVNEKTEKKNGLTYLSWAWAWTELKKTFPDAEYEIRFFDEKPYLYDENLGYMVMTEMTVDGITHEMWLPVMDGANKAMRDKPYTYEVKEYKNGRQTGNMIEKRVEAATMFDINTAIMRCLTKNISMFGLGLYIYAGEDLPQEDEAKKKEAEEQKKAEAEAKKIESQIIPSAKVSVLRGMCEKDKVPVEKVTELYSVKALEELTEKKFRNIVDHWSEIKARVM